MSRVTDIINQCYCKATRHINKPSVATDNAKASCSVDRLKTSMNGNLEQISLISDLAIATKQHLVQELASLKTMLQHEELHTRNGNNFDCCDQINKRKEEIKHRIKALSRT